MIRVGIIGAHVGGVRAAGSWGTRAHIPALQALPMFEVSAVATSSIETARETATAFGIRHAFGDPAELVVHPDVDVVAICVRVPEHFRLVTLAVEAGKHIYCEWPLGRDTAEAEALDAMVRARGVSAMIGLQGRFAPPIRFVRDLIARGEIGELRALSLNHSVPWPTSAAPSMIYLQTEASGANFLTIPGAHSLDIVEQLAGSCTSLAAVTRIQNERIAVRGSDETMQRDTPDQIAMLGVYGQGGTVGMIRFQGASAQGSGIVLDLEGSHGTLRLSPIDPAGSMMQIADLRVERSTGQGLFEPIEVPADYWRVTDLGTGGPPINIAHAWLAFTDAISEGRSPSPDFSDAVLLHRQLDGLRRAARDRSWTNPGA